MKRWIGIAVALVLTFQPLIVSASTVDLPLLGALRASRPNNYRTSLLGTPSLRLNLATTADLTLITALRALDATDPQSQMAKDDAAIIVLSALIASEENNPLGRYLEEIMGFSDTNIAAWVRRALPRDLVQTTYDSYRNSVQGAKRMAIGAVGITLAVAGGAFLIPLAFTGVGLIPALMIASVGSGIIEGGMALVQSASHENREILRRHMPELMVQLLGREQAEPGSEVSWRRLSYVPLEEIVARAKRSVLSRKALTEYASMYPNATGGQLQFLSRAQNVYGQNLFAMTMLLSVLSRQIAGISGHRQGLERLALADEGRNIVAGLVYNLNEAEAANLSAAVEALERNAEVYFGIPGYRPELEATRRKEILYTVYLFRAALVAKSSGDIIANSGHLESRMSRILGEHRSYQSFDEERARLRLQSALEAPRSTDSLSGALRELLLRSLNR